MNRREIVKMFGLGAGGLVLAPLLTRIARAGGAPARRFVFVVEGNGFEPVTMLSNSARAAIDARATAPIGEDRWWPDKAWRDCKLLVCKLMWVCYPPKASSSTSVFLNACNTVRLGCA